jgi:hypothetical protein
MVIWTEMSVVLLEKRKSDIRTIQNKKSEPATTYHPLFEHEG